MRTYLRSIPLIALLAAACDDPTGGTPPPATGPVAGAWVEVELELPGAGGIQQVELDTDALERVHLAVRRGGRIHVLARQAGSWTQVGAGPVVDTVAAGMAVAVAGTAPVVAWLETDGTIRVHMLQGGLWGPLGAMDTDLGAFPRVSAVWPDLYMAVDEASVYLGFIEETGVLALRHYSLAAGGWTVVATPLDEVGVIEGGQSAGNLSGLGLGDGGPVLVYRTTTGLSTMARLELGTWSTLATFAENVAVIRPHARRGPDGRPWIAARVDAPGGVTGRLLVAGGTGVTEPAAGAFATGLVPDRMRVGFDVGTPLVAFQVAGPVEHARRNEVLVRRPAGTGWVELGDEGPGASEPGVAGFAVAARVPWVALAVNEPADSVFMVRVLRFVPD